MAQTFRNRITTIAAVTAIGLGVMGSTDSALAQSRSIHNSTGSGNASFSSPAGNSSRVIHNTTPTQVLNFPQQRQAQPVQAQRPSCDAYGRPFVQNRGMDFRNQQFNVNRAPEVRNDFGNGNMRTVAPQQDRRIFSSQPYIGGGGAQQFNSMGRRISYSDGIGGRHERLVYNSGRGCYGYVGLDCEILATGWAFADNYSYTHAGNQLVPTGLIVVEGGNTTVMPLSQPDTGSSSYNSYGQAMDVGQQQPTSVNVMPAADNSQAVRNLQGMVRQLRTEVQQMNVASTGRILNEEQTWAEVTSVGHKAGWAIVGAGLLGIGILGRRRYLRNKEREQVYQDYLRGRTATPPPAATA